MKFTDSFDRVSEEQRNQLIDLKTGLESSIAGAKTENDLGNVIKQAQKALHELGLDERINASEFVHGIQHSLQREAKKWVESQQMLFVQSAR